jgi:hypothetical protein
MECSGATEKRVSGAMVILVSVVAAGRAGGRQW